MKRFPIKPAKILSFCAVVALCTHYSIQLQAYASKEFHLYKRQLAAQYIEEDLNAKDITVDIKDRQVKSASKMTIDDLKKALWILKVQKEQLQFSLDSVKNALEYKGGE